MTRYTVTYTRDALDALAREWLDAPDRRALTNAGDEIDRQLAVDATDKGEELREGLRRLTVFPLQAYDRMVHIWSIRKLPESAGND